MLGQGGPQFPFQQYLASRQASLPGAVAGQALSGINIPDLINLYQKQKAQSTLAQALSAMRTGQIPQNSLPDATGGVSSGPNQNYTPAVSSTPSPGAASGVSPELANALMLTNPDLVQKMFLEQLDPMKQQELAYKKAASEKDIADTTRTKAEAAAIPELRKSQIAKNNAEAGRALREKAAAAIKLPPGDDVFVKNIQKKISTNKAFTPAEISYAKSAFGVDISNDPSSGVMGLFQNPSATGVSNLTPEARSARKALGF